MMTLTDNPLTIVICFDHASVTGGQARVAFDSAMGLRAQGHRPIIFAAAGPVDPQLRDSGVEVICLDQTDLLGNPSRIAAAVQGTWNRRAAAALGRLLAGLDPARTIVHVHGWAKALSPSIAVPIAASGMAAVYTVHEYFLFCPNGGFYNYQKAHVCGLKPLSVACWATHCDSRNYPRKVWRATRLAFAREILHLPGAFSDYIVISRFQAEIVAPYLPKAVNVHAVSNPIGCPDLGPKQDAASGDVVFLGRISPEKGPLLFAEASRKAGRVPIFIGDGPSVPDIKALYPEARFLGWQAPDAARAALRHARALVFPSIWYEGQPLTVLEAKALGTPVVVSDNCAGREEVDDGVTGLWFKQGDADDLARALREIDDDATVARMSSAAHAVYWADPPTPERHVERLTVVYNGMLERRAGKVKLADPAFDPAAELV